MNNTGDPIRVFSTLGRFLGQFPAHSRMEGPDLTTINRKLYDRFSSAIGDEQFRNPWFTPENVELALSGLSALLERETLEKWLEPYAGKLRRNQPQKTVGLVLAGNIPLVGFHDVLCVLASGHRLLAKPSSRDERLIKLVAEAIATLDPGMGSRIGFTEDRLSGIDAVIATGSDNSARYFDYYFRHIPHIIRKNRNAAALLTGDETEDQLEALGTDIFSYFGLGCRNVTKLYIPEDYDLKKLLDALEGFHALMQHHKYMNNVEYYRSVYLMNRIDFLDNGFLLIKEDTATASPVGVVYYERYSELGKAAQILELRKEEIQCVLSVSSVPDHAVQPGCSQRPMPWDYADGVDTMAFLNELSEDDPSFQNNQ